MRRIYDYAGGRKQFNGYIAVVLITVAFLTDRATFVEYAGALLLALGITSGSVAWEGREQARARAQATEAKAEAVGAVAAAAAGDPGIRTRCNGCGRHYTHLRRGDECPHCDGTLEEQAP